LITKLALKRLPATALLLAAVLLFTHSVHWILPDVFGPLAAQVTDRLFTLRSSVESLRPDYDGTVVHIAIDDRTLGQSEDFYLGRDEYARVVRNLGPDVAVQLHDVIFAAPISEQEDRELEQATAEAGNVFYGAALGLTRRGGSGGGDSAGVLATELFERDRWVIGSDGDGSGLFGTTLRFATYPRLAAAAQGLGFLDVVADRDGTYRRAPLIARDGDRFVASLPLRAVCEYLGVEPQQIGLRPGRWLRLNGARRPGEDKPREIVIPVDRHGQMIINFVGPWGSMDHYSFDTVFHASDDRFELEDLREELRGKITVVSTVATGQGDIGPVPTDPVFPLSGLHANVMHSILNEEFLRELQSLQMMLIIELPLLVILLVGAMRLQSIPFIIFAAGLVLAYHVLAVVAFLFADTILNIPRPVIALVGSTVAVASYRYHVESKARAVLEGELAVAREIQLGVLPKTMPAVPGYDVSGMSLPATETGGDTFDLIPLGETRLVVLLGDATGHGVGPALSATQVRAMMRMATRLGADLDAIFTQINDQLEQDLPSNRFVTAFIGILDTESHRVTYYSAGQGPLLQYHAASGELEWFGSTSLALGMMSPAPGADSATVDLAPGDILALITDGVFEYENPSGELFDKAGVAKVVREHHAGPMLELQDRLLSAVQEYGRNVPQADDITMVLLRRLGG
jgi:serine phosphatase RsbU (regulator of sigma subunit)